MGETNKYSEQKVIEGIKQTSMYPKITSLSDLKYNEIYFNDSLVISEEDKIKERAIAYIERARSELRPEEFNYFVDNIKYLLTNFEGDTKQISDNFYNLKEQAKGIALKRHRALKDEIRQENNRDYKNFSKIGDIARYLEASRDESIIILRNQIGTDNLAKLVLINSISATMWVGVTLADVLKYGESLGISLLATTDKDLTLLEKSWELTKGLGSEALIASPLVIGKAIKIVAPLWAAALSKIGIKKVIKVGESTIKQASKIKKIKTPKLDKADLDRIKETEKGLIEKINKHKVDISKGKINGIDTSSHEKDLKIARELLKEYSRRHGIYNKPEGMNFKNGNIFKDWLIQNKGKILAGTGLLLIGGSTYKVINEKNGNIKVIKNIKSEFEDSLLKPKDYPVETLSLLMNQKQEIHKKTKIETKKLNIETKSKKPEVINKTSIIHFDNSKDSFDRTLVNQTRVVNVRTRLNKRNIKGDIAGTLENNERVKLTGNIKEGIKLTGNIKTTSSGIRFLEIKGGYFVAEKYLKHVKSTKLKIPEIDLQKELVDDFSEPVVVISKPKSSPELELQNELFRDYSSSTKIETKSSSKEDIKK